jgi:ceramide glucosyltransferase
LDVLLGGLTLTSLAITVWQWIVGRGFPLHHRVARAGFAPGVSLLKPVRGCDVETEACLESWLNQRYAGPVQILFGVESASDPANEVVQGLLAVHPDRDMQVVVCSEAVGPNAKVSTLTQLERWVRHEIVIVSDADVRVPVDFLENVIAPLHDVQVGVVTCLYRLANPVNWAMELEAIAINADFWSQVLQARSLKPLTFALGAAIAMRRDEVRGIGGFGALAEYLADDYELGRRIAQSGKLVVLSPVVVECWSGPMTFHEVWLHQLRWARTIRSCQPLPFFFSILSNATLWPALWLVWRLVWVEADVRRAVPGAAGLLWALGESGVTWFWALLVSVVCLAVRILSATNLQDKLTRSKRHHRAWWLVPVKDMFAVAVWLLAFLGRRVEWGGRVFRVLRGGKLVIG